MIKELLIGWATQHGSVVLFFSLLFEYIGILIPGETMMSFIGFLSWKQHGSFIYVAWLFAVMGTMTGSSLAWFLGRTYGETILLKYGKYVRITKEKLESASRSFYKHKLAFLLFGKFVPGVRQFVPYLSGISNMKFSEFLFYNFVGSIIWCTSVIGLGFVLGEQWVSVEKLVKAYFFIFILLAGFVWIVFTFYSKHKKIIFTITFPTLLFVKLIEDLIRNELAVFDSKIYGYMQKIISEDMTELMLGITSFGSGLAFLIISLSSLAVFWKHPRYALYSKMLTLNLVIVSILNEGFKLIFHRERPELLRLVEAGGFSFPSGHSMISMSFYGFIAYVIYVSVNSRLKYIGISMLVFLILLIGVSRIYLGVHYASDVIAGFSAGLVWLAIFVTLFNMVHRSNAKE